jgi:hypothetical protein
LETCPECGSFVAATDPVCGGCGALLPAGREQPLVSRRWLIGGAAAIAVVALGSVALVISGERLSDPNPAGAMKPGSGPTPMTVRTGEVSATLLGALRGASFGPPLSLGALADGRHWVVLTLRFTHAGDAPVTLDSDDFRLVAGDDYIKQAGSDTEPLATRVGLTYMGSGRTAIRLEARAVRDVVMVFKLDPAVAEPALFIEGTGMVIPVAPYVRPEGLWTSIAPPPTPTPLPTATATPA